MRKFSTLCAVLVLCTGMAFAKHPKKAHPVSPAKARQNAIKAQAKARKNGAKNNAKLRGKIAKPRKNHV